MKRWRGLLKKEWALSKWFAISFVVINLVITVLEVSPVVTGVLQANMTEILTSSNTWFNLNISMGVALLLVSLTNEMKREDIWLHSAASFRQLVGAKVLFAGLAVTCSLLLCGLVIGISGAGHSSGAEVLPFMVTIAMLVLNTVYIIIVAFFIWTIYQVLRSRMGLGWLAMGVTMVLWVVGMFVWAIIWLIPSFQSVKEMGPIFGSNTITAGLPYLRETNVMMAGLLPESTLMTAGSLLLYLIFSLALFIGGATLFEKKVRL